MAKTEIVNTSFNCQNKILYIQNLMHIYKYILTTFVSLTCIFFFFFELPFWRVGKSQRKFLGGGRGKSIFFHYFGERHWNFYDPKIEIWKISYSENKVKLNNEDKSKYNNNEIKEIIKPKYIILIFKKFKNFLQLAFNLLKIDNKNLRPRCAICLKITNIRTWKM